MTRIDALDIVSCRARPVDAPTAWNRREAPFWSRMATCTVTLRGGLTKLRRSTTYGMDHGDPPWLQIPRPYQRFLWGFMGGAPSDMSEAD